MTEDTTPSQPISEVDEALTRYEGRVATYEQRLRKNEINLGHFEQDLEYAKEMFRQELAELLHKAEVRGRIMEVDHFGYQPVNLSYPDYAKRRTEELEASLNKTGVEE